MVVDTAVRLHQEIREVPRRLMVLAELALRSLVLTLEDRATVSTAMVAAVEHVNTWVVMLAEGEAVEVD